MMNTKALFPLFVPCVLVSVASVASAQHSVTVPVEIERSSNPSLSPDPSPGVTRLRVSPQYTIETQGPGARTEFAVGGVLERSSNTAVSANRADPRIRYLWETVGGQNLYGLSASYEEASTRASEFAETGLVTVDSTQRTGLLGARWTHNLSQNSNFVTDVSYGTVNYQTDLLVDYVETGLTAAYTLDLAPGNRFQVRARAIHLDPEGDRVSSSSTTLRVNYEVVLSEGLSGTFGFGGSRITGVERATGWIGILRLAYEGERLQTAAELTQDISPSGTVGGYARTRALRWDSSYPLTENTTFRFALGSTRTLGSDGGTGNSALVGLRTELTSFWSLVGQLERQRSRFSDGRSGRANVFMVGLVYSHPDF
jgi:hypothetical protein